MKFLWDFYYIIQHVMEIHVYPANQVNNFLLCWLYPLRLKGGKTNSKVLTRE